jgi:rhamnosyltransferase
VLEVRNELLLSRRSPSIEARLKKTGIIIPTYNAVVFWPALQDALDKQGILPQQVLIVDSSSTDETRKLAKDAGYRVVKIPKSSFGHGTTRQMASSHMQWADTLVYLTQDALPCGQDCIANLLRAFDNPEVGAAYGRQRPRDEARGIEAHARLFNYPSVSAVRNFASREALGFRATFFSNSFAAYRRSAFEEVGGFPAHVIVSEEVTVVAKMMMAGWSVAYCADAEVIHSHRLSLRAEFSRYFDIAVHHSRERWILDEFGQVGGEGALFLLSEFRYLLDKDAVLIPQAAARNICKWMAYRTGLRERYLPRWAKRLMSAQPSYWDRAGSMRLIKGRGKSVPSGVGVRWPANRG